MFPPYPENPPSQAIFQIYHFSFIFLSPPFFWTTPSSAFAPALLLLYLPNSLRIGFRPVLVWPVAEVPRRPYCKLAACGTRPDAPVPRRSYRKLAAKSACVIRQHEGVCITRKRKAIHWGKGDSGRKTWQEHKGARSGFTRF